MNSRRVIAGAIAMTVVGSVTYPVHGQLAPVTQGTQLVVEVSGLNEQQGQICLNLFDSGAGFPSDRSKAVKTQCMATIDSSSPLLTTFENLSPGSYAVSAFHDANGDDEFNRNFVGMPVEGFGFSRNPEARTGPPEFSDAVILVAGPEMKIEIELSYF